MTSDSHSDSYKEMLVPPRSSTATPTSAYRGHNVNSVFSGFIPHCEPVLDAGQLLPALYQEKKS